MQRSTVNNIKRENPGVVLALGDLGYEGFGSGSVCNNTDTWFKMMRPIDKNP
jgi:hypothetical protein